MSQSRLTRVRSPTRLEALTLSGGRDSDHWRDQWLEWLAQITLVIAFGIVAGPIGVLFGGVTVVVWYGLGTPYALAVGHVLLVVLFPTGIDPFSFALVEAPFLLCVLAPFVQRRVRRHLGALLVLLTILGFGGATWLVFDLSASLWLSSALLVGALAVFGYGLHRFELVSVGLVDHESDTHRRKDTDTDTDTSPERTS